MLKIIHAKKFHGVKYSLFCSICKLFLTVDGCKRNEHLKHSQRLVYYEVLGEPGITSCSRRLDNYLRGWELLQSSLHKPFFVCVNFSWLVSTVKLFFTVSHKIMASLPVKHCCQKDRQCWQQRKVNNVLYSEQQGDKNHINHALISNICSRNKMKSWLSL